MNKQELVNAMAEKAGITKDNAAKALNAFIETTHEALKAGDKIAIIGFGTFSVNERKERQGRNPKTKETITIAAKKVAHFKAGKGLEL